MHIRPQKIRSATYFQLNTAQRLYQDNELPGDVMETLHWPGWPIAVLIRLLVDKP